MPLADKPHPKRVLMDFGYAVIDEQIGCCHRFDSTEGRQLYLIVFDVLISRHVTRLNSIRLVADIKQESNKKIMPYSKQSMRQALLDQRMRLAVSSYCVLYIQPLFSPCHDVWERQEILSDHCMCISSCAG